jgi:Family of unknown function (DUF6444)
VSDLCALDPVSPPEDWHHTPTSVRQQVLALMKRVEALEARLHRDSSNSSRPPSTDFPTKNANDGCKLLSAASLGPSVGILAISRSCWSRLHLYRAFPRHVPVAIVSFQRSPCNTRIKS